VPIFQFAVFYENDLWATPAGEIQHGLPGVSSANGGVWFKDANNTYQNMYKSGS
jgi:hypothetical protein